MTGRRPETNVPAQAMYLMNNPFVKDQASLVAKRLLATVAAESDDQNRQICAAAFRQILCRAPIESELVTITAYLDNRSEEEPQEVWTEVIQTLFASTEFRMLE